MYKDKSLAWQEQYEGCTNNTDLHRILLGIYQIFSLRGLKNSKESEENSAWSI